ncbi:hypothetical protein TNCV_3271881 [Trichonephila clavipes]|nr:hypothetical protein TNCV_3271881 [Trichonephila clavipes]
MKLNHDIQPTFRDYPCPNIPEQDEHNTGVPVLVEQTLRGGRAITMTQIRKATDSRKSLHSTLGGIVHKII